MDITIDDINEKLNILSKKLQDNVSEAEYKETMLKVIKDKSID